MMKATTPSRPKPLDPPAMEAELNEASRVWTEAQEIMVARGFGLHLWGSQPSSCHEFVVLMLRAAQNAPLCHGAKEGAE